ncbi:MAG TPA: hypothetical protein VFY96_16575, partial [Candidatus Binatia bacterium]|nr:hypothetical protein [Candidatus Binatia bacterium]
SIFLVAKSCLRSDHFSRNSRDKVPGHPSQCSAPPSRGFLKAPASMATNSGACNSDTAGTATLMSLTGISAENILAGDVSHRASVKTKLSSASSYR